MNSYVRRAITAEKEQNLRYAHYKSYDEDKYYILKVYDIIKNINEKVHFKKSLDVGCADGSFSKKLKDDFGFSVFGLDISESAVRLANANGVMAKVHNLENELPFQNNTFDLIIACEIIEHLYDTDFFISELKRVLRKDGVLILTTPNLVSLVNRIKIVFGAYPSFVPEYRIGGAGHIRAYTIPVLKEQLKSHGFTLVLTSSPNIAFPMANKIMPQILKRIAMKLGDYFPNIGSHMIVVVRK